jgi:spermidine/putrescine transport system permease protein
MKAPGLRAYAILYLVFLYAPIALLPLFAFNNAVVIAFPLEGFTTKWFVAMWEDPQLWNALRNSLFISTTVGAVSTLLGLFAARATTRYRFRGQTSILGLIMLPLVLPEIVVAMSLIVVLVAIGVPLSIFTIILGHILITTPFAVTILSSAFQTLDRSLEEAAYDLGESAASTFRLIILPLVMPGIISSFLICFIVSLDEYIIASFLGGTEPVLSTYIFGQFRFPAKVPAVLALGTILVLISIILLAFAEYMRRRGIAKAGGNTSGGVL